MGIAVYLIQAAVEYARQQGAKMVEAYPSVPQGRRLSPVSSFMGLPSIRCLRMPSVSNAEINVQMQESEAPV